MNTNKLYEKALSAVYSFRMNAYVEGADLAAMYAHEMEHYLQKKDKHADFEELYNYVYDRLALDECQAA